MNLSKKYCIAFLCFFSISIISIAQSTKVISYNIRYDNNWDTINNWQDRKDKIAVLLNKYNAPIIGIQEGLFNQVEYLNTSLKNHNYFGIGRDGEQKGEYSAIFYDTTIFKLLQNNTFWLSETPNNNSIGWDAALNRICTYGLLENLKTKQKIWVFNTHFDHIGKVARENSVKLILRKIKQLNTNNYPIILMGDFNMTPNQQPITILNNELDDASKISKTTLIGPTGTFNGFSLDEVTRKIDYFFTKNLTILSYTHVNDLLDNSNHISDHLPIIIELKN